MYDKYAALFLDEKYKWSEQLDKHPHWLKDAINKKRPTEEIEAEAEYRKMNGGNREATLCWICANAVPSPNPKGYGYKAGCEWSIYGQKVPGWDAEECHVGGLTKPSFLVKSCPKFKRG